jgi:hypothetical protein
MKSEKPLSRTEANKPNETAHLQPGEKQSLDILAEAEHAHGDLREQLTQEAQKLAQESKPRRTV